MTDEELAAIRERCDKADYVTYGNWGHDPTDAEADMENLLAEVARLRREILAADSNSDGFDWSVLERLDKLEAAEAEVVRLRSEVARLRALISDASGAGKWKENPSGAQPQNTREAEQADALTDCEGWPYAAALRRLAGD